MNKLLEHCVENFKLNNPQITEELTLIPEIFKIQSGKGFLLNYIILLSRQSHEMHFVLVDVDSVIEFIDKNHQIEYYGDIIDPKYYIGKYNRVNTHEESENKE